MSQLALDGGEPVRKKLLPYGRQTVTDADVRAVEAVLRSDFLTTGPAVAAFEADLATVASTRHAVAVSSGTAALHAMYAAAGIGPGDEVIVPAITFAATANAALYVGATPVFADVHPNTLLISAEDLERRITSRTRAIVGVDFAGQAADYDAIYEIARQHGLMVFADGAHAIGARRYGRPVGSLADATSFSFHPVKHVAAGEGGAVVTDMEELAERARVFRNHGITSDHAKRSEAGTWVYDQVMLGFNYRMSDLHCALGSAQIVRLDWNLAERRSIARRYDAAFSSIEGISPLETVAGNDHAYHLYVIRLDPGRFSKSRSEFFAALRAENIGVNVHYIPVPWHPYYQSLGYERGQWPAAESSYENILTLPLWAGMTEADVSNVLEAVEKVARAYRK